MYAVHHAIHHTLTSSLKVREHPLSGTYVEGLTSEEVSSFAEVKRLLDKGNEQRVSAATSMNEVSSRSHAIFTLHVTLYSLVEEEASEKGGGKKGKGGGQEGDTTETTSKVQLIDLAGTIYPLCPLCPLCPLYSLDRPGRYNIPTVPTVHTILT
jgi:hypothetical protein